jgi:hypothetical protein
MEYAMAVAGIARGRSSAIKVQLRGAHLQTLRDDLVYRLRGFADQEEALHAGGLS